jgi:Carboxypeptidase regulatory-like domain
MVLIIVRMKFLRLSLLLLFAASSSRAGTLSGTVRDSEGAVLTNAHITVHWDPSGSQYLKGNHGIKQDLTVETDSNGRFSLDLPPGFYDVFVSSSAFSPQCAKIRIKDEVTKTYEFKLKASPVTSKELD